MDVRGADAFHAHVVSFGGDADPTIDGNRLQAFERCGEGCGAGVYPTP